jgi:hypothetical protein
MRHGGRFNRWRTSRITARYGNVEPPPVGEFAANTALCAAVIPPAFFALTPRNRALLDGVVADLTGRALADPLSRWTRATKRGALS